MKKTFKKVVSRIAIFIIVLSMMITSQVSISSAAIDFNGPDFNFTQILFVKHQPYPSSYGENHMADGYFGFNGVQGGGLFRLDNAFTSPTAVNLLSGKTCTNGRYSGQALTAGTVFKADLSYDGNTIVFSYSDATRSWDVWNLGTTYHIFKCNKDGTNIVQLTDGVYNDINPVWMPDGRICFISERRGGFGRCHQRVVPTFTLHTMNADGSDIRAISMHETNEWNPAIDNSGMIIYTRWDYVNRGATHTHSSWICAPDGSDPRPIALNYTNSGANPWRNGPPMMQTYFSPIPNSNKLLCAAVPHHAQSYGSIIIVDPDVEDDDYLSCITKITTELNYPESVVGATADQKYSTPWALSETNYLCVYASGGWSDSVRYQIYALDKTNQKTMIYGDASWSCFAPIPLRARTAPQPVVSSYKPAGQPADGIVSVMNVYDSLLPITGYTINKLRIWQVYGKSTVHADDPSPSYESTWSNWAGRNTQGLWGTVPVLSDGSASFYLPANKCFLFSSVDSSDKAVQIMRSDAFVIGGMTRLTCQGCHEPRHRAVAQKSAEPLALAACRTPDTITADIYNTTGAKPMCFPRLIQPILDSKCISCHTGGTRIDLRKGTLNGDGWSVSYNSLRNYVHLIDVHYGGNPNQWDYQYPRTEPGIFGARHSDLTTYLTNATHNSLTTANEKHAFYIWMDSSFEPYYGSYVDKAGQQAGNQVEVVMD